MFQRPPLLPECENRGPCLLTLFFILMYFFCFAQALHGCRQPVVPSRPVFWARASPSLGSPYESFKSLTHPFCGGGKNGFDSTSQKVARH